MDRAASTKRDVLERMLLDQSVEPTDLPLSLLEYITNGFSDDKQIGSGGFAVVYKGMLRNGTIAVKKLFNTHLYENKFHQEVECLMKTKHKNVVRFLGYCADTQGIMLSYNEKLVMADVPQRLLCFEYLPKGSLHDYITDASRELGWTQYYQIIKGICAGLNYLHQNRIVHLDLKPSNILLDGSMVPKIADFGLSRCFDENQSHVITTKLFGSLGYLAPEFHCGRLTFKSDMYSLGVIIIEILTRERVYPEDFDVLESWGSRLENLHRDTQLEQLRVCTEIGKECTDYDPRRRPDALTIVDRLDKADSPIVTDMSNVSLAQFIPNGTVADHLHGSRAAERGLTWPLRMNIAIETAESLAYLHAVEIIHRDVKTTNILLDNSFHVKVADFGLSRLFPLEVTHVSTVPQGTPGYVDPVYHQCYKLSDKSDVYSFGVVLVELISSKPAVDMSRSHSEINLANMALNRIQNDEVVQLVDPELGYDTDKETKRSIDRVAEVAFQCLQLERELRPSIKEVVEVLTCIRDGDCPAKNMSKNTSLNEDAHLLRHSQQYSPDSVIHRFHSQSTNHSVASNASGV